MRIGVDIPRVSEAVVDKKAVHVSPGAVPPRLVGHSADGQSPQPVPLRAPLLPRCFENDMMIMFDISLAHPAPQFFEIVVSVGGRRWSLKKRYSELHAFHDRVRASLWLQ